MRRIFIPLLLIGATTIWNGWSLASYERLRADILAQKIPFLEVRDASIIEAIHTLKINVPSRWIIFTLEVAPYYGAPEKNLTLDLRDSSVKDILERLTSQDPRYDYLVIDETLIHVFPRDAKDDTGNLLNLKVSHFEISEGRYDLLLKYPLYHIPELQIEYMKRSKSGRIVGSMMGGGDVPKVSLSLRDVTVREILNHISLKTKDFPEQTNIRTGWMYTFRIDKSVPLGGHPRWQIF